MAHDLDAEVTRLINDDLPDARCPLILQGIDESERAELVTYVLNKVELTGATPRDDYADLTADDDDDDDESLDLWPDDDDDGDDDEADRFDDDEDV